MTGCAIAMGLASMEVELRRCGLQNFDLGMSVKGNPDCLPCRQSAQPRNHNNTRLNQLTHRAAPGKRRNHGVAAGRMRRIFAQQHAIA
jgi:hypothetical protein